ncbi:hypothetical protein RASY3_14715 [Ruminococcus albus SY3]|uniref:Uncharacterized protein n=1 Tax=Ruminococcus albus SY3 TaxID=1341156 RepID=A0A011WNK7_RUMAL|nr:hypothetical protein [Ruminococcus albus]EXM38560.1 hypothetical protein RASY3_14715 [Ruminococcus albus SY3]
MVVKMISLQQVQDLVYDYLSKCKYYEATGKDAADDICGLIGMCDIVDVEINEESSSDGIYS